MVDVRVAGHRAEGKEGAKVVVADWSAGGVHAKDGCEEIIIHSRSDNLG